MVGSSLILGSPVYGASNFDLTSKSRPSGQVAGRSTLNTTGSVTLNAAGRTVVSFNLPLVNGGYVAQGSTSGIAGATLIDNTGSTTLIFGRGGALAAGGAPTQHNTFDKFTQQITFSQNTHTRAERERERENHHRRSHLHFC